MVEFKKSMDKPTLQGIAAEVGIDTDGMTKDQIVAALEAHNAAENPEAPAEGAQGGAESADGSGEGNSTTPGENAAQGAESAGEGGENTEPEEDDPEAPAEGVQDGAESADGSGEGNSTTPGENAVQGGTEGAGSGKNGAAEECDLYVYAGPSLPRGRLKQNAVFNGTFEDVKKYLADVLEDYPQVARLIVPADRLAAFSVKVKTPGNIAHKYYTDIVSAMSGKREV